MQQSTVQCSAPICCCFSLGRRGMEFSPLIIRDVAARIREELAEHDFVFLNGGVPMQPGDGKAACATAIIAKVIYTT